MCGIAMLTLAPASGCAPAHIAPPPSAQQRSRAAEQTRTAGSLSASLDGLAFVRDGRLYRVSGGVATEIVRDGRGKLGVVPAGVGALLVTEEHGDGVDVVYVRGEGTKSTRMLLHVAEASTLLGERLGRSSGQLYRAMQGDPAARLLKSPLDAPSNVTTLSLPSAFSGEFDVNGADDTLVYTSATQNPTRLLVVDSPQRTRELTAGLAAIFTPAVAGSGDRICFTGQQRTGDPIALWVFELRRNALRRLASTVGLTPTHPVFSEDGSRIAFRGGRDGALHVVRADGSGLQTLPFSADDATLAW